MLGHAGCDMGVVVLHPGNLQACSQGILCREVVRMQVGHEEMRFDPEQLFESSQALQEEFMGLEILQVSNMLTKENQIIPANGKAIG
jgi:hypothetical protein